MAGFSDQDDRRAYDGEWQTKLDPMSRGIFEALADPLSAVASRRNEIGGQSTTIRVVAGKIVGAAAYVHGYRVFFGSGSPPRICTPIVQTSLGAFGMRQLNTYVPGTTVYVLITRDLPYGLILGAEPSPITSPDAALPDMISQASRCGISVDLAHSGLLNLGKGGYPDLSSGRPADSLPSGEYGAISETGMRFFGDSHMLSAAADEFSGLWVFYDQLTRLGGRHLQVDSAGASYESLEDQGEFRSYSGESPYPWEALGRYSPGDPARRLPAQDYQIDKAHYAALEPAEDRQSPFHRIVTLGGYVGHGRKTYVFLPPAPDGFHTIGGEPPIAVAEDHTGLTGVRSIRSAKMTIVGKFHAIPGPAELRRPEDAGGDTPDNYRFAGLGEKGAAHAVSDEVATSDDDAVGQRMAAVADVLSHALNYEAVQPLHAHAKDWKLPEEGDTVLGLATETPDFATLATEQSLPAPPPQKIRVDHRYGDASYTPNTALQVFLQEGQVVILDGFGAELRMGGGDITLSCPGDIVLRPGRNLVGMAGHDVALRANNSADISANKRDVRIKARVNLQMVGGVGGTGGVLLESRGASAYEYEKTGEDAVSGGVQVKSAGDVAVWGHDLYLRSTAGQVVVDAAAGEGDVLVTASAMRRYLRDSAVDAFGSPDSPDAVNSWGVDNLLGGTLKAGGDAVLGGTLIVNGTVSVAAGNITTSGAAAAANKVESLTGGSLNAARRSVSQQGDAIADAAAAAGTSYAADIDRRWYGEGAAGNTTVINRAGFSFRSAVQYMAKKWRMWESGWQQRARLAGKTMATWVEQPVAAGSDQTYPYPGREAWEAGTGYYRQDLGLSDDGVSKDRDAKLYGRPTMIRPDKVKPDGNYTIIA